MQIEFVYIKKFRNLEEFKIEFSQSKTVLIGQNASGKSNFLEAIALIFKQIDFPNNIIKELWFEYELIYQIYGKKVKILRTNKSTIFQEFTGNKDTFGEDVYKIISRNNFIKPENQYLPKYIFAYYSGLGNSNRLQ